MIISGLEYPTSNLFLGEVRRVNKLLDSKSESSDVFVREMVKNIKQRFDKHRGECNLLMCIAVVLDPQMKMQNFSKNATLGELYDEYAAMYSSATRRSGSTTSTSSVGGKRRTGLCELIEDRACKFPNILAVLITTVASEATFSATF
ncbi:Zinc finger BED domain-containing protein RICESLEEPER 3 [Bienertia sinuspersici]